MATNMFKILLLSLNLCIYVHSERLHEQIYSSIEGGAACFRRLNATHQTGCSSANNGAVGVIQMIRNVNDALWLVQNATAGPYMAVVSTILFDNVIEIFLEQPTEIAGVVLYENISNSATFFTQESRCPNEYYAAEGSSCSSSMSGGNVWNKKGTGLLRRDIPFPILYLSKSKFSEIDKMEECFEKFNTDKNNQKGRPLCSIQLNSFMFAAVNSEICLRRSASSALLTPTKVCDPLGDQNIYYSLFPRIEEYRIDANVTMVTARIDSASMFDGVSPGAASSVVGMVTLLTAATTLSKLVPNDSSLYPQNVLWTLFNGESFDYIGSQRVAYDISKAAWPADSPLFPDDISLHVELGQIGGSLSSNNNDSSWPFYAYVPYKDEIPPQLSEFLNEFSKNAVKYNLTVATENTTNLPPSSLHSFRRILKNVTESGSLAEVLLVDFKDTFTNMFYQSALDNLDNINFNYRNLTIDSNGIFISTEDLLANGTMKEYDIQVKISRFATVLARTLYKRVIGEDYSGNITASAHLVDEMLYCFLRSQACRLMAAAEYGTSNDNPDIPPDNAAPLYVGVSTWYSTAPVFAGHLLALLTGTYVSANRTRCHELDHLGYSYYWLRGWNHTGVCIQTTMNMSPAVSPAFNITDYDFSSGMYSTWTESVWQAMWARMFVSAGGSGARTACGTGVAATLIATLLTFWLKKHAHIVFSDSPTHVNVDDNATTGILRTVNC